MKDNIKQFSGVNSMQPKPSEEKYSSVGDCPYHKAPCTCAFGDLGHVMGKELSPSKKKERCEACDAPFEHHHHKHIVKEKIYHTGCYRKCFGDSCKCEIRYTKTYAIRQVNEKCKAHNDKQD